MEYMTLSPKASERVVINFNVFMVNVIDQLYFRHEYLVCYLLHPGQPKLFNLVNEFPGLMA